MNAIRIVFLMAMAMFCCVNVHASCYTTLSLGYVKVSDVSTREEDKIIASRYVEGSIRKDTDIKAEEYQLGCYIGKNMGLELGYIPRIKLGTDTTVKLNYGGYTSSEVHLIRRIEGSAFMISGIYYFGSTLDTVRPYIRLAAISAKATGTASLKTGDYSLNYSLLRSEWAATFAVGIVIDLPSTTAEGVAEYRYYGKRGYSNILLGIRQSF